MSYLYLIFAVFMTSFVFQDVNGLLKRCFQCRSRGDLGSCRDPFPYNVTQAENELGLYVVPCASGWCGKVIEGGSRFKDDDYGVATQRLCLQRGPSDDQERCADIIRNHKRVYMCFCNGDMCNGGTSTRAVPLVITGLGLMLIWRYFVL